MAEPGRRSGCLCRCCGHRRGLVLPHLSQAVTLTAGRSWHHVARLAVHDGHASAIGCRGFAGPIPPPLWMSVIQLCASTIRIAALISGEYWPGGTTAVLARGATPRNPPL